MFFLYTCVVHCSSGDRWPKLQEDLHCHGYRPRHGHRSAQNCTRCRSRYITITAHWTCPFFFKFSFTHITRCQVLSQSLTSPNHNISQALHSCLVASPKKRRQWTWTPSTPLTWRGRGPLPSATDALFRPLCFVHGPESPRMCSLVNRSSSSVLRWLDCTRRLWDDGWFMLCKGDKRKYSFLRTGIEYNFD